MIQTMLWPLLVFAILLLVLIQSLFALLRRDDAALFEALGSPDLFTNNNATQVYRFWRWLYTTFVNRSLSTRARAIAWIIRLLTPIYLLAILALILKSVLA